MSLPFKIYFRFGADILLLPTVPLYHIAVVELSWLKFVRFRVLYFKYVWKYM
jgi:hypothetical protein